MIKKQATVISFASTSSNKIRILERKPVNGGIPPIEKKIITKEKAHNLFTLKKFVKLDKNIDVVFLL